MNPNPTKETPVSNTKPFMESAIETQPISDSQASKFKFSLSSLSFSSIQHVNSLLSVTFVISIGALIIYFLVQSLTGTGALVFQNNRINNPLGQKLNQAKAFSSPTAQPSGEDSAVTIVQNNTDLQKASQDLDATNFSAIDEGIKKLDTISF